MPEIEYTEGKIILYHPLPTSRAIGLGCYSICPAIEESAVGLGRQSLARAGIALPGGPLC
jgi:hypothetical protein